MVTVIRYFATSLFLLLIYVGNVIASDGLSEDNSAPTKQVETLDEVSIIGTNELPNVSFDLPWRLPSVQRRGETSPPKQIPGMLDPIEPLRHKQKVHFSRYLEVDVPQFDAR